MTSTGLSTSTSSGAPAVRSSAPFVQWYGPLSKWREMIALHLIVSAVHSAQTGVFSWRQYRGPY